MRDHDGKHPHFDLRRAMTDIPGYVCCVPSKQAAIRQIRSQINSFRKNPTRHVSMMLVADPGSGKTFFVNKLAKAHRLHELHFNITQMVSKRDILGCFDTIVTTQAQNRDEQVVVFIDEINALLDGQPVYDAFLAPIEDGEYVREGKTFSIKPCAWIFAGTENPAEQDKSAKGPDFASRLTIPAITFKHRPGEEIYLRTENVYLGVSLLTNYFPQVRKVEEKVLKAFELLRPDADLRRIRHFVRSFVNVQREVVTEDNIPMEIFRELADMVAWNKLPERHEQPQRPEFRKIIID
jgi:hypothetical protein